MIDEPKGRVLAERICDRVALGESLARICSDSGLPSLEDVIRWEQEDPRFATALDRARKARAEVFLDQVLEIIDKLEHGDITAADAQVVIDGLKLLVECSDPEAYGPRKFIVIEGEITLILPDGSEVLLRPTGLTVMATGLH